MFKRPPRSAFILAAAAGLIISALLGCSYLMSAAPIEPVEPVLGAFEGDPRVDSPQAWRERRTPLLQAAFQREIYGQLPDLGPARIAERRVLDLAELTPRAVAEEWSVVLGEGAHRFNLLIIAPREAARPLPVIEMQLFCGTRAALPGRPEEISDTLNPVFSGCNDTGLMNVAIHIILGRYINGPPIEDVIDRGYALAMFYPGDVVADDPERAPAQLAELTGDPKPGALAVWATLFSSAYDVLAQDARFDAERIAIWGHSRHGKAALLAGAFDHRFAAVIAHQSGRFGAALTAPNRGERRDQIIDKYGYWFPPTLTDTSPMTVDQHMLLALNAPTPVFVGNGEGDAWADPKSTWRTLQGADPVYRLLGSAGLQQPTPEEPTWRGDLVYWARGGGHGVTTADWRAFMAFLDAHLAADQGDATQ